MVTDSAESPSVATMNAPPALVPRIADPKNTSSRAGPEALNLVLEVNGPCNSSFRLWPDVAALRAY